MKPIKSLQKGERFKWNPQDGGIRNSSIGIIHETPFADGYIYFNYEGEPYNTFRTKRIDELVRTEEEIEVTKEEWIQKYKFSDLVTGQEFKWGKESFLCTKISTRDRHNMYHEGYINWTSNVHYQMSSSAYDSYQTVWTLENVTTKEKQWV